MKSKNKIRYLIQFLATLAITQLFPFSNLSLWGAAENPLAKEFHYKPFQYNPYNFKPLSESPYFFVGGEGQADQVGGIYYDEIEKKYLIFSKTFLDMHTNLFVSDKVQLGSLSELKKIPVGVVKGDFAHKYFTKNFPQVNLLLFDSYEDVIINAVNGKIKAFVQNFPHAMFFLSKYGALKNFKQYQLFDPSSLKLDKTPVAQEPENRDELRSSIIKDIEQLLAQQKKAALEEKEGFFPQWFSHWIFLLLLFLTFFVGIFWLSWFFFRRRHHRTLSMLSERSGQSVEQIISQGENDQTEFKASLRWDHRKSQANTELEMVVAKTICAFLNTHGGTLFIGIDDSGNAVGLEQDYVTLGKKAGKDGFLLRLAHVINLYLGKKSHLFIHSEIASYEGQEICRVQVFPGNEPFFLNLKQKEEFFIRTSASSQALSLKETHEYIKSHWKAR